MLDLAMITSTAPKQEGMQSRRSPQDDTQSPQRETSFEKEYEAAEKTKDTREDVREKNDDPVATSEQEEPKPEARDAENAETPTKDTADETAFENALDTAFLNEEEPLPDLSATDTVVDEQALTGLSEKRSASAAAEGHPAHHKPVKGSVSARIGLETAGTAAQQGPRLPSAAETALTVRAADQAQAATQNTSNNAAAPIDIPGATAFAQMQGSARDPNGLTKATNGRSSGPEVATIPEATGSKRADRADKAEMILAERVSRTPTASAQQILQTSAQQSTLQLATPPSGTAEKLDPLTPLTDQPDIVMSTEVRSSTSTSSSALSQILARGETPTMIARQMAEALQRLPDKPVEISLNPRELGRVRMNISAAETGITVSVIAERPETLDLLRRNIEQLVTEFHAIGYESINFAFSEGHTSQTASDENENGTTSDSSRVELSAESEDRAPEQVTDPSIGMDLRL